MEMIRVMRIMGSRIEMALGQNRRMTDSHRGNTHEEHGSFDHEDHSTREEKWEVIHRRNERHMPRHMGF